MIHTPTSFTDLFENKQDKSFLCPENYYCKTNGLPHILSEKRSRGLPVRTVDQRKIYHNPSQPSSWQSNPVQKKYYSGSRLRID
jgi:hypothetical protein